MVKNVKIILKHSDKKYKIYQEKTWKRNQETSKIKRGIRVALKGAINRLTHGPK